MKDSRHSIEYFLSNKYFVRWVKNPGEESDDFWQKWLRNHPESHEAFNQAKAIVERIHFRSDPAIGHKKEGIFDLILKNETSTHFKQGSERSISLRRVYPVVSRLMVACLLVILIASYLFSPYTVVDVQDDELSQRAFVTKESPQGQKTTFYLPDKSRVVLNSGSKISYPEKFGVESREVFLEGEAYFDVAYDSLKTFLAHSGKVVTQVHGTVFNICAYPGEQISIALERGLVSVYPQQHEAVIPQYLKPGEMLKVYEDFGQSTKTRFDYEEQFGWKDGKLVFKGADMAALVKKLERWYGVEITVLGNLSDRWEVSGFFKDESLENILEGIKYVRNITYRIDGNRVQINTEPHSSHN